MTEALKQRLNEELDYIPTVLDYDYLISLAVRRLGIDREEARRRYGMWTYARWKEAIAGGFI